MSAFVNSTSFFGRRVSASRRATRSQRRLGGIVCSVEWAGKNRTIEIDGIPLSFDYIPGQYPVVMYLPPFFYAKDPMAKANSLKAFCERRGQGFISQDYYGTGRSGGDFVDGTISLWTDHVIEILERVLRNQKVVLVTSGVGLWIGVQVALRRKTQVVGIVGMSVDPDFTEELIVPSFSDEQKSILEEDGVVEIVWGYKTYPISKKFIENAKTQLILQGGPESIEVECPVRLLQGMADEEIPDELALRLASSLQSKDVRLTYIKGSNHSMETEPDFKLMCDSTEQILDQFFEFDLRTPGSG